MSASPLVRRAGPEAAHLCARRQERVKGAFRLDLSVFTTARMLEQLSPDREASQKVRIKIAQQLDIRLAMLKTTEMIELRPVLQHKDTKIVLVGLIIGAWLWGSVVVGHLIGKPHLTQTETQLLPLLGIVILVGFVMIVPFIAAGRSPHIRYRPEELDVAQGGGVTFRQTPRASARSRTAAPHAASTSTSVTPTAATTRPASSSR